MTPAHIHSLISVAPQFLGHGDLVRFSRIDRTFHDHLAPELRERSQLVAVIKNLQKNQGLEALALLPPIKTRYQPLHDGLLGALLTGVFTNEELACGLRELIRAGLIIDGHSRHKGKTPLELVLERREDPDSLAVVELLLHKSLPFAGKDYVSCPLSQAVTTERYQFAFAIAKAQGHGFGMRIGDVHSVLEMVMGRPITGPLELFCRDMVELDPRCLTQGVQWGKEAFSLQELAKKCQHERFAELVERLWEHLQASPRHRAQFHKECSFLSSPLPQPLAVLKA